MARRTRAQRRADKRARVQRDERCKPPPEAARHHRPWPMQTLLALGPEDGGIDADEFEAALQIVETFKILTDELGERAVAACMGERLYLGPRHAMSERDAERCAVWFDWAMRLPRGLPVRLVAWVEDEAPIGSVEVLRRACRLWSKVKQDRARPIHGVDMTLPGVLTIPLEELRPADIAARPPNLPVQSICPPPGVVAHASRPAPMGGQMRATAGPHAQPSTHPPPARFGRHR